MIDSEKDNRPAELATNKKNNLLPNDSDDTNDLADIIRHAMIKIKADQCGASKSLKENIKILAQFVVKIALIINKLSSVLSVITGFIESVMVFRKKNLLF